MKKTNTHSYTKPDLIVGPFSVLLKILFGFVIVFAAGTLVPSQALAWDCTLSASPTTIQEGSSSTLAWTTINSTSFSIDNGVGSTTSISSGTTSVSPTTTTTYTGTAHGPQGSITCKVTITVTPKPTPPAPTCTLSASSSSVSSNSSATLSWTTTNATSFSISNGVGVVTQTDSGSTSVSSAVTTYTGTASSSSSSVTCTATVTPPPPPTCHTYSKNDGKITGSIDKGNATLTIPANVCPVEVSFSSYNLPDGKILPYSHQVLYDNITHTYGPGTHAIGPLKLACNWQTDLYLGGVQTTVGPSGTQGLIAYDDLTGQHCSPPPPPPAPTCTLSANPVTIQTGSSSTLSWTTTNATSFSISNGVGSVTPALSGSTTTSPTADTTYTGTAHGPGGSVNCTTDVTVTSTPPPPPPAPTCTLSANPVTIQTGSSSTLSWTTTNAISFAIDNNVGTTTPVVGGATTTGAISANTTYTGTATGTGGSVKCSATVTVPPPVTGCTANCGGGGGGGGGGSSPSPSVLLTALPHVGSQPLAYLYLSQIPYTGLDLGPVGTIVYWAALIVFALVLAYLVLFGAVPFVSRSFQDFGSRVKEALNIQEPAYAGGHFASAVTAELAPTPAKIQEQPYEAPRGYSSYEGFKSFAHNDSLSIDDIVKGLARSHSVPTTVEPEIELSQKVGHNVEPVYENVEPIYKNIDTIMTDIAPETMAIASAPTHVRGFIAALIEGDRAAVFAGLRQYIRGAGAPEKLIAETACLLDDAYRARLDGTSSDPDTTRLVARLDTPTLEKLVASLTTAIDSSYSTGVTGAKIALTRALAVLGA